MARASQELSYSFYLQSSPEKVILQSWFQTMALNLCHMSLKHFSKAAASCTENHLSIIRERMEKSNASVTAWRTVCKPLRWKGSHGRSSQGISYTYIMHSTTQLSPAELLHGRPMCTKLHVAGCPLPHSAPLSSQEVAIRVEKNRKRVKHTLIRNVVPSQYPSHVGHTCGWRSLVFFLKHMQVFQTTQSDGRKEDSTPTFCQMDGAGTHVTSHLPLFRRRRVTMNCYLWTLKLHQLYHNQRNTHHMPDQSGSEECLSGLKTLLLNNVLHERKKKWKCLGYSVLNEYKAGRKC